MRTRKLLKVLWLVLILPVAPVGATETYELLFETDGLAGIVEGDSVHYETRRAGRSAPEVPGREWVGLPDATRLTLAIAPDDAAIMTLAQDGAMRQVGIFPASVGNPVIMYFLETVLRDMAAQAGGSPFYIRNRIKEALLNEAEVVSVTLTLQGREVAAERVTLRPFAADGARDRMGGFADLLLEATVSPDVPGRFYALAATAPTDAGGQVPGYSNIITFLLDGEGTP